MHKFMVFLLEKLSGQPNVLKFLAFTLDYAPVVTAIKDFLRSGGRVELIADEYEATRGRTRNMQTALRDLATHGAEVRLASGSDLETEYAAASNRSAHAHMQNFGSRKGRMHAKGFMIGNYGTLGSTNWTVSSRASREVNPVWEYTEEGKEEFNNIFREIFEGASPFPAGRHQPARST